MVDARAHTVLLEVTVEVAEGEPRQGLVADALERCARALRTGSVGAVGEMAFYPTRVRWNATGARLDDAVAAVPAEPGPIVYAVDDTASIAARLRELEAERAGARSGAEVGEFAPAKPAVRPVPRVPEKLDPLDPLNPLWSQMVLGVQIEADNQRQAERLQWLRSHGVEGVYRPELGPTSWIGAASALADTLAQTPSALATAMLGQEGAASVQSVVFQHDAGRSLLGGGRALSHYMGRATFTGLASDGDE